MERLQKVIATAGIASRRKAEELILQGKVFVNGNKVAELGTKVSGNDIITVNGKQITKKEDKEYYILNKPRGVITSTKDECNRKTVVDLVVTDTRIYPVGRLDYDTTGLVILTNDGELANLLMHPSSEIPKTYVAKIDGIITGAVVNTMKKGIKIDNSICYPERIKIKKIDKLKQSSVVEIVIHEGKYHEVKRIFEQVGYNVDKLKRTGYAFLTLEGVKPGEYRRLTRKEVKKLYSLVNKD